MSVEWGIFFFRHTCIPHLVQTHLLAVGVLGRYHSWTRKQVNKMERRNLVSLRLKNSKSNPILCPTRLIENVNNIMDYGWRRILTFSPSWKVFPKKEKPLDSIRIWHLWQRNDMTSATIRSKISHVWMPTYFRQPQSIFFGTCNAIYLYMHWNWNMVWRRHISQFPEASDSSLVMGVRRPKQEVTMQWRRIDDDDTNGEQLPRCGLETQFNQCDAANAGRRRHHTPYLWIHKRTFSAAQVPIELSGLFLCIN